ncbi:MAG TPA: hypothetical protein VF791_17010 [Pyrinomonadaceae bacterium]
MNGNRIAVLPFVALLLLTAVYAQQNPQAGPIVNSAGDIRQIDFKNFAYAGPKSEQDAKPVELRDGKQISAGGAETSLMRVAYGDLTGDRNDEAVVLLRGQNTRISRTLDELFVYTLKNGKVTALAHFDGGRRGEYVLSIGSLGSNFKIEDGLLVLDHAILREGEDVPTHYYTVKYRWNGVQMAEVERSALKPLPENMMEIG